MVISWLTSSWTPDIAESVQYSYTAESIRTQLCTRYGSVSGTKIYELKKELASTNQGSLDIASYFNKLKKLWDELRFLCTNHINICTCAAKTVLQKEEEENKVYQFLIGLNETYIGVRRNLLIMQPFPSLDSAYNILLQDERRRQVTFTTQLSPNSASFHASLNKRPPISHSYPSKPYNPRVNFEQDKSSLFCKYCKRTGHLMEKCYRLHGYPPDFKFTNSKGKKVAASAEVQTSILALFNLLFSQLLLVLVT
ncbi:uncharacterized protein LOC132057192 [Lycium ferocissimum]|uniref:uncharacterized protein LOC132057192 n=1 Tax=Lycium ferocissimum TaxID=112874 RepID=UPI00281672BD|nr:uncharacterized protein LOC132057192 [Lycium ferocissimum]XP_059305666.1 uncharacterized protein LOC132057192 [Lycium ferocissimum]